ncbi:hypothetical protein HKCCE3408_05120 [Rhodobacterales bacterium HKCCE3408]|nr:hypothetical protein [Rhodobacterales bacterium HKCCE3408]
MMALHHQEPDAYTVWVMANDVGLEVDLKLLFELQEQSPSLLRQAHEMLSKGKSDDLAIEPFFLRLLAQTVDIQTSEEEILELSARQRLDVLKGLEFARRVKVWERRYKSWALMVTAGILLSYPLLVAALVWTYFGLPIIPDEQVLASMPDWQIGFIRWATELWEPALFIAYLCVAIGPAVLAGLLLFLLILLIVTILEFPRLTE